MQPGSDPRLRLILAHLKQASSRLDLSPDAPPRDKGVREGGVREVDRDGVIQHAARPEGVMAQPSEPQFSSSQAVICV